MTTPSKPAPATLLKPPTAPDGAYANTPAGAGGLATSDPAAVRLRVTCAAWGVTPHTTDPVTDQAAQQPSTVGNAG